MPKVAFRREVSIRGLLSVARRAFAAIPENKKRCQIPLVDHLMSGLAVFGLKYPSLLQFDQDSRAEKVTRHNLRQLYGIERAPCDTSLGFEVLDGHYLLSMDGAGYFSSQKVHCQQCCEKHHRNGQITYYHQLLGAVLVHPEH